MRGKVSTDGEESGQQFDDPVRAGITEGRIRSAFQPLVILAEQTIRGWEALVRLHDPDLGDIPALTIVAVAKRLGLLEEMTSQVADQAFDTLIAARSAYGLRGAFSINFERDQLETWTPTLEHLLARSKADHITVSVEISERSFDRWTPANTAVVDQIRANGGTVSLDDFGTGFSALGALHLAPVQVVKLDKSMADSIGNERHLLLLRRVVEMLRELDFRVLVEGIESAEDAKTLQELGVEFGQGFYFGQPISAEALMERARLHGSDALVSDIPSTPRSSG